MELDLQNTSSFSLKNIFNLRENIGYIILLFGFAIYFSYFITIQYVPIINLESLALLIITSALVGFIIISSLTLLLNYGAWYWSNIIKNPIILSLVLKYIKSSNFTEIPHILPLYLRRIAAFLYLITTSSYLLFFFGADYFKITNIEYCLAFFGILSLIITQIMCLFPFNTQNKIFKKGFIFINIISISAISAVIMIFLAHLIQVLYQETYPGKDNNFITFICVLLPLITSTVCLLAVRGTNENRNRLIISSLFCIMIFIFMGLGSATTRDIIRFFNLGALENTNLHVNYDGCQILKSYSFNIDCHPQQVSVAKNVNVLWRLGEYYIQFEKDNQIYKLVLPTENVKGLGFISITKISSK